jgi:DNA polymerase III subunit gamma/tau
MAYTVLARKYRPQSFDDLIGQEHVARTLSNAIEADRVAHAFLFTGVRGVGKTTTARLLAKALNCEKGPTSTPCNECGPCIEITAGIDVDVQEIDGASNNSVEDVRRLQESLPYRPQRDRSKIVIVDEVHMLSTGAFNAFLKTLEEPPDHVKFIFATTESHKVPVTIRSRCQQYDFRLIPHRLIAERVRAILEAEALSADDEAIAVVAREAAGSMRDALTLLDQLVAISDDRITADTVAASLGIAARDALYDVARAVLEGDGARVIGAIDSLADKSVDMPHFARQLLELMRDLVVLKLGAGNPAEWVPEEREGAESLIGDIDILELQRAFRATSMVMDEMAHSPNPKLMLEMGLVRVATRPPLQSVSELLARLDALQGHPGPVGGVSSTPRPRNQAPSRRPVPRDPSPTPSRSLGPNPSPRSSPTPNPSPSLRTLASQSCRLPSTRVGFTPAAGTCSPRSAEQRCKSGKSWSVLWSSSNQRSLQCSSTGFPRSSVRTGSFSPSRPDRSMAKQSRPNRSQRSCGSRSNSLEPARKSRSASMRSPMRHPRRWRLLQRSEEKRRSRPSEKKRSTIPACAMRSTYFQNRLES